MAAAELLQETGLSAAVFGSEMTRLELNRKK